MSEVKSRLADRLRSRCDQGLADLDAVYNYHTDMIAAWQAASTIFATGGGVPYAVRPITGTPVTPADLLARTDDYLAVRHTQATFLTILATFEAYLVDLLRVWLTAFPRSLGQKSLTAAEIADLPDKDAILDALVDSALRELAFKGPADWFQYLEQRAKVRCSGDDIAVFTEAKASRDVVAHNAGVVNRTYVFKAGGRGRFTVGEKLDLPEPYHRDVWAAVRRLTDEAGSGLAAAAN